MAKTLVIKGANYSANKVATVEFDRIHTTGLSITDTDISISSIGGTHQITYTITPSNSEDPVLWESSNENVCTVDSDGIVTAVGLGTATITGTSNGHSDTVSATVVAEMTGLIRAPKTRLSPAPSSSAHAVGADTYIGETLTGYDALMAMLDTDSTKTKLNANVYFAVLDENTNKYYLPDSYPDTGAAKRVMERIGYIVPIKLINGCTKIVCKGLNEHYGAYPMFCKSETRGNSNDTNQQYFSAYKETGVQPNNYSWVYQESKEFTVPSGYDSVCVLWQADTANGAVSFASMTQEQLDEFTLTCI